MELGKQGENTGRNYSEVNTVYSNRTFKIDIVTGDGDSGGPYYNNRGDTDSDGVDEIDIAAVHNYAIEEDAHGGVYIGEVENKFGVV